MEHFFGTQNTVSMEIFSFLWSFSFFQLLKYEFRRKQKKDNSLCLLYKIPGILGF